MVDDKMEWIKPQLGHRFFYEDKFERQQDNANHFLQSYEELLNEIQGSTLTAQGTETAIRTLHPYNKDWRYLHDDHLLDTIMDAGQYHFVPGPDPLQVQYNQLVKRFSKLKATLETVMSQKFPQLFDEFYPRQTPSVQGEVMNSTVQSMSSKKSALYFNPDKFVPDKFTGDNPDQNIQLYAAWRASWSLFAQELEQLPDFNKILAFNKLKLTLDGSALRLINTFSPMDEGSYDAALDRLDEKYADRMALAESFILEAAEDDPDNFARAENVLRTASAMKSLRNTFEEEGVDMYEFSFMVNVRANFPQKMKEDWACFKERMKQQFLRSEEAKTKRWRAGMVEKLDVFESWLREFLAPKAAGKVSSSETPTKPTPSTSNVYHVKTMKQAKPNDKPCVMCDGTHGITNCSKALNMNKREFVNSCRSKGVCSRCQKPWTADHNKLCKISCSKCPEDPKHNWVMCPKNPKRTAQPEKRDRSADSGQPLRKRPRGDDTGRRENLKKLLSLADMLDDPTDAERKVNERKTKPIQPDINKKSRKN